MKTIDNMSYSQWQKRNAEAFKKLSKKQQQKIRKTGYFNLGWKKIETSWEILSSFSESPSFFDLKLKKGDFAGAFDQCILETEQFHKLAQQAIEELNHSHNILNKLAQSALDKYQLL